MSDQPSSVETHLLIALREAPSYGYALMGAVEEQSRGELSPDIGSLYRTLARLMERGWVEEVAAPEGAETSSRGKARRYYGMTPEGSLALAEQVGRLEALVSLARGGGLGQAAG